jgi:uncharacterized phiE125 gp8 family phage protein
VIDTFYPTPHALSRPGTEIGCEWTLVTPPDGEPITLDAAKRHCRITHDDENSLIQSYIAAGRQAAEDALGRGLLTQTWKFTSERWANVLWLPMAAPLQSVTSVKYYDAIGTLQTLATTVYTVDLVSRPGRIAKAAGQTWPSLQSDRRVGRIEITYVVGWLTPADVPERIKQGIRSYVGYLDSDREGLDVDADKARAAAEACWIDRVYWKPPTWVAWW